VAEMHRLGAIVGIAADVTQPRRWSTFRRSRPPIRRARHTCEQCGEGVFRKVGEMTVDDWRRNIDLNLNGAFYCTHAALSRFAKRDGGFVINISSLAAKNAFSGGAGYNASKFGLNGFTEALMLDHRYDNVRVCSVMPGSVATSSPATLPSVRPIPVGRLHPRMWPRWFQWFCECQRVLWSVRWRCGQQSPRSKVT